MLIGKASPEDMSLHPINHQWAYDLYQQAVRNTWFPHEIALKEDLEDLAARVWDGVVTLKERELFVDSYDFVAEKR